jgi:hypothetical protein
MKWFSYDELDKDAQEWREVKYTPALNVIKKIVHLADSEGKPLCGSRIYVNDLEPTGDSVTCERCLARVEPVKEVVKRYDHALFKNWKEG